MLKKLAKVIDEPFMGRSHEAAKMNDHISELDARQRQEAAKIALLQADHDVIELQTSLRPLVQYLDKLKGSRGNAVTKALRAEIKGTEKQITEIKKKIIIITADIKQLQQSVKKITAKIKELAGPMSNAVRSALRGLGIELTVYWSGQFVGPQIAKLMSKEAYREFFGQLDQAFNVMTPKLSTYEIHQGRALLHEMRQLFGTFFILLSLVKTTQKISLSDASDIEQAVLLLSRRYRKFIPGPVTTKFHALEAHLVDFVTEFSCSWPYSEEGVESAHHWIRLFREKTAGVTGWKQKYENFASAWQANQSLSGVQQLDEVLARGRFRKYAPRPNRKRKFVTLSMEDF